MGNRKQTVVSATSFGGSTAPKWTETEVRTFESWDETKCASLTRVRTAHDAKFVDLAVEEYTGETRRAKYCSVRLEEEAGRALFEQLKSIYKD